MKKRSFLSAGTSCVGVIAGLCVAAGPAAAKVPASVAAGYHPAHQTASLGVVSPNTGGSTNAFFGGYKQADFGGLSTTETVQVPTAKCANRNDDEDVFLGVQLSPSGGNAYQGGSNDGGADVIMFCDGSSTTPTYWLEAYTAGGGDNYGAVANPGDLVQFSFSDAYGGSESATTTDLNTGGSETSTGASTGVDTELYLGVIPNLFYEQAGSVVDKAIPKFGTLKFDNAIINGRPWTTARPGVSSLEQNSDIQIKAPAVPTTSTYNLTLTEAHTL